MVLARQPDPQRPSGVDELLRPLRTAAAQGQLLPGERAEHPQQVRDALGVPDPALVGAPLELGLQVGEHARVEQLAQLGLAEQLREQGRVQRECGGTPLGERGVALVQVLGDVAEEERARERRGLARGDLDQSDAPGLDVGHQLGEAGHVEHVLETLADRLEDDRK